MYCEGWTGWRDYWTKVHVLYSRGKPVSAVDRRQGYSRLMYAYKQLLLQTYVWKEMEDFIIYHCIYYIKLKYTLENSNGDKRTENTSKLSKFSSKILELLPWTEFSIWALENDFWTHIAGVTLDTDYILFIKRKNNFIKLPH